MGVSFVSSIDLIGAICVMLARGALISALVSIFLMPAILCVCEPLFNKTSYHWKTPDPSPALPEPASTESLPEAADPLPETAPTESLPEASSTEPLPETTEPLPETASASEPESLPDPPEEAKKHHPKKKARKEKTPAGVK